MADVSVAFVNHPVPGGEQTAFVEGVVGIGETTVELDLAGDVRLSALAFEAGFEGATITVGAVVPWASGDVTQAVNSLSVAVSAGEVVAVPFTDMFYLGKILLTISAVQTAAHKIGFLGWRGKAG